MKTDKRTCQYYKIQKKFNILKSLIFSLFGIFVYFVPFTIMGNKTILLDHLVTAIVAAMPELVSIITLCMIILGGLLPFYEKNWNKDTTSVIMSGLKVLGATLSIMTFFNFGPQWLMREDMLPLLFNTIAIPLTIIIPLGSLFLTFITSYGLLGFLGVLLKPVMRPIWKLPGSAAVNAVASFIGSFSVGIFMTNKLFKEGRYNRQEAAIIVTGFSTVSATFMIIIAKNLNLMSVWGTFFWTTVIVTFLVSAITVRLKPLKSIKGEYANTERKVESETTERLLNSAINEALKEIENNKFILKDISNNLKDGIFMSLRFLPFTLGIGGISFYLIKMTFFFDILAYIFYPIIFILKIPEPWMVAKAIVTVGGQVLMPSLIMAGLEAPIATRFITGVVSISSILFFSGTIPCIISTDIDISIKDILLILIERIVITLVIITPLTKVLL